MFKLVDRTKFNTSTQGTGDIVPIGSVSSSAFYLPSEVGLADGDTVRYIINDGTDVEEGIGTIADSVATLQRTTVSKSKVGGVAGTSKLSLSGLALVSLTASGADILVPANNLSDLEDIPTARTNLGTTAVGDAVLTATDKAAARTAIASPLLGHLFGLALSTAGSSATFGVAVGEAADSTGVDLMVLASAFTKTTSAWSSGTGNGALDTGTIANTTWYHVHVIKNPTTGAVDVLISLSATDPTLPSGFTLFRRIGSMKTDGSGHWTAFAQVGDVFRLDPPSTDVIAQSPGTGGTNYTLTTPTGVSVEAFGYGFWVSTARRNI